MADFGSRTIYYNPAKLGGVGRYWRYTIAHERCHALTASVDELGADACAASYGVDISPSPYQ